MVAKDGVCSLCGLPYFDYGHNPAPLKSYSERCCDHCNEAEVIPARLLAWGLKTRGDGGEYVTDER